MHTPHHLKDNYIHFNNLLLEKQELTIKGEWYILLLKVIKAEEQDIEAVGYLQGRAEISRKQGGCPFLDPSKINKSHNWSRWETHDTIDF